MAVQITASMLMFDPLTLFTSSQWDILTPRVAQDCPELNISVKKFTEPAIIECEMVHELAMARYIVSYRISRY